MTAEVGSLDSVHMAAERRVEGSGRTRVAAQDKGSMLGQDMRFATVEVEAVVASSLAVRSRAVVLTGTGVQRRCWQPSSKQEAYWWSCRSSFSDARKKPVLGW